MIRRILKTFIVSLMMISVQSSVFSAWQIAGPSESPVVPMQWHRVSLTVDGPNTSESAAPNPFMDYRMNVTFTHRGTGKSYLVPGYYAADGNAANTSASSGNKWRAHLCPDHEGTWDFTVSFRQGANVAVNDSPTAGTAVTSCDGITGSFTVAPTDKTGPDMRAKGRLEYVGGHFLRFAGTGEYFLKQGADAPENFLAYAHFDGSFKSDGRKDNLVKNWQPHVGDWKPGDPTWSKLDGAAGIYGKGIIGAVNYLASEGMNAFSFLPMNINGDDRNVFPYTSYTERYRMDCSKLDQWEIVFEHGDRMGMFLHFKTQETENELLLDSGNLGNQRKLYYRELIARFSHHIALNWNLGEEINNATTAQKKSWAQYFYDNDPYRHHIVIHNGANHHDLLGSGSKLTGFSLQTNRADFSNVFTKVKDYIDRSVAAGKPWAVACDEPGDASHALRPDYDAGNSHEDGRKNALWATFMAGGWGNEWYFGYQHDHSDLTCQDFRSRDKWWDYCRYALLFFTAGDDNDRKPVPVWNMSNANGRVTGTGNRCLYGNDEDGKPCLVVQTDNGGSFTVNAPAAALYKVGWMNAKTGTWQYGSDIVNHPGGDISFTAPGSDDWILLLHDWAAGCSEVSVDIVTDGIVDELDLFALAQYWLQEDCCQHANCFGTDLDSNGIVNIDDFAILSQNWKKLILTPCTPPDIDIVKDGVIDEHDLYAMAGKWLQLNCCMDDNCRGADLDGSGHVNCRDLAILAANWGKDLLPQTLTFEYVPVDDAYRENSSYFNNQTLKLEKDSRLRVSFLKFVITGIPNGYSVTKAVLELTENGDPGNGTIRFHRGDNNDWTETTIYSSNEPAPLDQVAVRTGSVSTGQTISVDISPLVTSNGTYTVIASLDPGGNDIWFASSETPTKKPQLKITANRI